MSKIDPSNLRTFVRQQLLPPPHIKMSDMIASKWPPVSSLILNWSFFFCWTFSASSAQRSWLGGGDRAAGSLLDIGWNFICSIGSVCFCGTRIDVSRYLVALEGLKIGFNWEFSSRSWKKCFKSIKENLFSFNFSCVSFHFFLNCCVERDDVFYVSSSKLVAFRKCQRLRLPPRLCSHIMARLSSLLSLGCLAVVKPQAATRPDLLVGKSVSSFLFLSPEETVSSCSNISIVLL